MSATQWVHLDVDRIVAETDKALLLLIDGEEFWIPLNQISDPDDYLLGIVDCTVTVTRWIAEKKGLI